MENQSIIIQTTTSTDEEAKLIAQHLVKESLAACIHIYPVTSIYKWDKEICENEEFILSLKTTKSQKDEVFRQIEKLHSYELPELIYFPIKGSQNYLRWIIENSNGS